MRAGDPISSVILQAKGQMPKLELSQISCVDTIRWLE